MARYIDENDVYKLVEPTGVARVHCSQIDELQRADVVPESEVERLKNILHSYALQYGTVMDQHKVIEKVKAEVAREIFEGIEKCMEHDYISSIGVYNGALELRIAELKKKYTEDCDD